MSTRNGLSSIFAGSTFVPRWRIEEAGAAEQTEPRVG
jgi:hypothetical protein